MICLALGTGNGTLKYQNSLAIEAGIVETWTL
jgi:hypothetical protein